MDKNTETFKGQTSNNIGCDKSSDKTINALIVGQQFGSWKELDQYISLYAKSQNFATRQTRSKHTRCRWQVCTSCPKTTEILSINSLSLNHNDYSIEDQTNKFAYQMLTKQYPDAFFLRQDLSNTIQSFKRQNNIKCEYKNWMHSITGSIFTNASFEFSPDIEQWIISYLTLASLSMQWQEIAQTIWYTSRFVENFQELGLYFNSIEQVNSNEQCDSIDLTEPEKIEIFNTFAEDTINIPVILLRELVSFVNIISILEIWKVIRNAVFHIMLIPKRWYNDEKQIETESQTRQQLFIIGLGNSIKVKTLVHIKQSFPDMSFCLLNISYNNIYNKINYRRLYVTVNGLTKKAIQTGLDASSLNSSSDEEDITAIENPIICSKRENKNRSSSNQNSESQKTRKPTQYQQCQNIGHNKAGCKAWYKYK
ncbi:11262_t:CDS:2, partial [Gigaspora margarita]